MTVGKLFSTFFLPVERKSPILKKTLVAAAVVQAIHVLALIVFTSTPPFIIGQFALNGVCLLLASRTRMPIIIPTLTACWGAYSLLTFSASLLPIVAF